jgi:hypothetical protein
MIDQRRTEAAPLTPGGLQGCNVSDKINNPSNQPADDRPVDPDKLQIAADVGLGVFDDVLIPQPWTISSMRTAACWL